MLVADETNISVPSSSLLQQTICIGKLAKLVQFSEEHMQPNKKAIVQRCWHCIVILGVGFKFLSELCISILFHNSTQIL